MIIHIWRSYLYFFNREYTILTYLDQTHIIEYFWNDELYFFGLMYTKTIASSQWYLLGITVREILTFSISAWTTCLYIKKSMLNFEKTGIMQWNVYWRRAFCYLNIILFRFCFLSVKFSIEFLMFFVIEKYFAWDWIMKWNLFG